MKTQLWQLRPAVIGIIAVEFRKEEDKEEAAQGSDLHLCSNPAHISHCCPRTAGCGDREGRIRHLQSSGCQPQPIQHITQHCCQQRKQQLLYIPLPIAAEPDVSSSSSAVNTFSIQEALYLRHNRKKTLQEDDIHLYCCFVSKVRRQLGMLQLRRGNGTSCYWQGTDVWGKVGIQRPFFFWQKSTRETQETRRDCHPMKERPLNIQGGWHANIFWFYTPKTSDNWSCQRLWARGETWRVRLPQHEKAKLS